MSSKITDSNSTPRTCHQTCQRSWIAIHCQTTYVSGHAHDNEECKRYEHVQFADMSCIKQTRAHASASRIITVQAWHACEQSLTSAMTMSRRSESRNSIYYWANHNTKLACNHACHMIEHVQCYNDDYDSMAMPRCNNASQGSYLCHVRQSVCIKVTAQSVKTQSAKMICATLITKSRQTPKIIAENTSWKYRISIPSNNTIT